MAKMSRFPPTFEIIVGSIDKNNNNCYNLVFKNEYLKQKPNPLSTGIKPILKEYKKWI